MNPLEILWQHPQYAVMGVVLLGLMYLIYRSTRRTLDRAAAPRRRLTYECVVTPAAKADDELRGRFPSLDTLGPPDALKLVRFGLFNWGEMALAADHIERPVVLCFGDDDEVVSVAIGETIKTEFDMPEPPVAEGSRVSFAPFAMSARGTVIFNLVIRGEARPVRVEGFIKDGGPIRRLS